MPRRLGLLTLGVVIVILSLTGCGLKKYRKETGQ